MQKNGAPFQILLDAKPEVIAEGFEWSEGPLWVEKENMLLFSDVPKNIVYKWTEAKGREVYLTPSGYTGKEPRGGEMGSNGLTLNAKGQLVLCQHGNRQVAVMDAPVHQPAPVFIPLAAQFKSKRFNSPNDLTFDSKGNLYFTDPPYGLLKNMSDSSKELPFQGVFRVSSSGEVFLLTDSLTRPNGIALSPDGKKMIVANSDPKQPNWYMYDVEENGAIANGRIFYDASEAAKTESGLPDGLKIDREGTVFASGPGGVWIFTMEGKLLGRIRLQTTASNCALSADEKWLFVTADNNVVRLHIRN